jgi:small GTP-binding protein
MPEHKIILMGQANVGKTAIGIRFLQGAFVNKYDPTIEDSYRKNVQIEGVHYLVEILDTAGDPRLTAMPELNWKDGQGYILVYSIASRESFEFLKNKRKEIEKITETSDVSTFNEHLELQINR